MCLGIGVVRWTSVRFGELDRSEHVRLLVPSTIAFVSGLQLVFGSFLLGISTMKLNSTPASFAERRTCRGDERGVNRS